MAVEMKYAELSDEQISKCIEKCHDKFINASNSSEAKEWAEIMARFMTEQRNRLDLLLKDETEAIKIDNESKVIVNDLKQSKKKTIFEGLGIAVSAASAFGTIFSAICNLKAKKIEYDAKSTAWHEICAYEEQGEIPLQQPTKHIKL